MFVVVSVRTGKMQSDPSFLLTVLIFWYFLLLSKE
jgi:hypothetical protein